MTTDTLKLRAALAPLYKLAGRRLSLPILNCVHMEAKDGTLSLRATDIDQDQTETLPCDGELQACCASVSTLSRLVAIGKDKTELTLDKGWLVVDSNGKARIGTQPIAEFPAKIEGGFVSVGVQPADLLQCISTVKFAQSTDNNSRQALCCVHVITEPHRIFAEATTGKNWAKIELLAVAAASEFTVTNGFVDGFCAALERENSVFALSEKHLRVTHEFGCYACKRSELSYPNTKGFVSGKERHIGQIQTAELLEVAEICRQMATDEMARVAVAFGPQSAECVFVSKTGARYDRTIDGKFAELQACFDAESLILILSNTTKDSFDVSCDDSLSPFVFNGGETTFVTGQVRTN